MKGFVNFVREQGVVGLAVGLAIGLQSVDTVNKLVSGLINPLVTWALGWVMENPAALEGLNVTIAQNSDHALTIGWGMIVSGAIKLLAVAFVVYGLVKRFKLDKLDRAKKK